MSDQPKEGSIDIHTLITQRGFTYESLIACLAQQGLSDEQLRVLEALYLYYAKPEELQKTIARFLERHYPKDTALQKIAEVLGEHGNERAEVNVHATRSLYVELLMTITGVAKSEAVNSAASHFCVSEAAIWKSLSRNSTDN
jgi:hypothetical protein